MFLRCVSCVSHMCHQICYILSHISHTFAYVTHTFSHVSDMSVIHWHYATSYLLSTSLPLRLKHIAVIHRSHIVSAMHSNMIAQCKHEEARPGFVMFELSVMLACCCPLIAWTLFMTRCYCKTITSQKVRPTH